MRWMAGHIQPGTARHPDSSANKTTGDIGVKQAKHQLTITSYQIPMLELSMA
jgi:hypothetical protein